MVKHILYLASGSSRRFGSNKLLYPLEGKPMFLWGLETLRKAVKGREDCTVTVVSRYGPIRAAAQAMGFAAVDSPDSERGISHTIRAGLGALDGVSPEDFLLFMVADQPWLRPASVEKLLDQAVDSTEGACLCWGDRPGNPVLFSARRIPELMALEGDTGGRAVLRRYPWVPVSAGGPEELADIDFSESDLL